MNIEPNFILEFINFIESILDRMKIYNFNVDEIFLHSNRDNKIRTQFENYEKDNSICYGVNLSFPEININFDVTEEGLGKLLFEKVKCSDFFIWLGYGLVGKEQSMLLTEVLIKSHLGSLNNLIQKVVVLYKEQMSSEITRIGFSGLWGQIRQFFGGKKKLIEMKQTPGNDDKFFKILENKYNFEKNGIHLMKLEKGKKYLYVFSDAFLFVFEDGTFKIGDKMEYSAIEYVLLKNEDIIIHLKEGMKNQNKKSEMTIRCENAYIAENVFRTLNEVYRNI